MGRFALLLAAAVAIAAALAIVLSSSDGPVPSSAPTAVAALAPAPAPAPHPVATPPPARPQDDGAASLPSPPEEPAADGAEGQAVDDARLEMILADARMRERARQQQLAEAADARWHEGVDSAGYRADDFDPAVRSLFRGITLEPSYAEGGRIEGLVIVDLLEEHPLAEQGFQRGDRIDSIQGVPLRDPAEIPAILAHLGPRFEICAVQADAGTELCRELDLE